MGTEAENFSTNERQIPESLGVPGPGEMTMACGANEVTSARVI